MTFKNVKLHLDVERLCSLNLDALLVPINL